MKMRKQKRRNLVHHGEFSAWHPQDRGSENYWYDIEMQAWYPDDTGKQKQEEAVKWADLIFLEHGEAKISVSPAAPSSMAHHPHDDGETKKRW